MRKKESSDPVIFLFSIQYHAGNRNSRTNNTLWVPVATVWISKILFPLPNTSMCAIKRHWKGTDWNLKETKMGLKKDSGCWFPLDFCSRFNFSNYQHHLHSQNSILKSLRFLVEFVTACCSIFLEHNTFFISCVLKYALEYLSFILGQDSAFERSKSCAQTLKAENLKGYAGRRTVFRGRENERKFQNEANLH